MTLTDIKFKYNINTLEQLSTREFQLNDIGRVTLSFDQPIALLKPMLTARAWARLC